MNKILISLFLIFLVPDYALSESIDKKMQDWLQSNGIQTGGAGAKAIGYQGGGYATLPSGGMRYPVSQIQVGANVTMPSFSAGCGGIDFNLGSIEFLRTGENIRRQIQQIGTGMVPVAIMLGMQTVTPQLTSIMQEFQKKVDEYTKFSLDTCEASKALVMGTMAAVGKGEAACVAYHVDKGKEVAQARAICADAYGDELAGRGEDEKEADKNFVEGNLTWYLMANSGLYGEADVGNMQLMMNFLGTRIYRVKETGDKAAPNNDSPYTEIKPLLGMDDDTFDKVMESYIGEKPGTTGPANKPFEVDYQGCKDITAGLGARECLVLLPPQKMVIESQETRKKVKDALGGILRHIERDEAFDGNAWTALEKAIVAEEQVPIYRYMISLAAYSPGLASEQDASLNTFADSYAKIVFMRNVNSIASALYQTMAQKSIQNEDAKDYAKQLQELMRSVSSRIKEKHNFMADQEQLVKRIEGFEKVLANRLGNAMMQTTMFEGLD